MDVLRYAGAPDKEKERVQEYFNYITQYNHPTNEGLQFLYDLPRALYEEIAGYLFKQVRSSVLNATSCIPWIAPLCIPWIAPLCSIGPDMR